MSTATFTRTLRFTALNASISPCNGLGSISFNENELKVNATVGLKFPECEVGAVDTQDAYISAVQKNSGITVLHVECLQGDVSVDMWITLSHQNSRPAGQAYVCSPLGNCATYTVVPQI